MKILISLLLLVHLNLYADSFNSTEKAALKYAEERAHYCKIFTSKALAYKKTMRDDELAQTTLNSYENRAKIYCSKVEPKKVQKMEEKNVEKQKDIKDISREDERLCKIFQNKLNTYKKTMRTDELAYTTLESYKKRAAYFCGTKSHQGK